MKPILYAPGETNFKTNGIGTLYDTISCKVTEERNGAYELEMTYPANGRYYDDIKKLSIIKVKVNNNDLYPYQLFQVYSISRPISGEVEIHAEHISYRLSYMIVKPYKAIGAQEAMSSIPRYTVGACPFTFWTDKDVTSTYQQVLPLTARSILGGVEGSMIDTFKGELEWDNFNIKLWKNRGADRGVVLRYGKNITDITQEESIEDTYTSVCPYWEDQEGDVLTLPEYIIDSEYAGAYANKRIQLLDLSSDFDSKPTVEKLRKRAEKYIKDNDVGIPKISIEVSFVDLYQTDEYKDKEFHEEIKLCDTVHVIFEPLGILAKAKVIETVYDVLLERFESFKVGNAKVDLGDTIKKIVKADGLFVKKTTVINYSPSGEGNADISPLSNFDIEAALSN